MPMDNARYAVVNRSSTNIPVYSELVRSTYYTGGVTAGGDKIGTIYPNEFYTIIPNDSRNITSHEIIFRNSDGAEVHGYIETSEEYQAGVDTEFAWVQYQEPYHYYNSDGSTLVAAATEKINGITHYIYTVDGSERTYRDKKGTYKGKLAVGTKLAARGSTTGQTYGGYMVFYKKKDPGVHSWQDLIPGETYGFVDLGLSVGSTPSKRPIR